MSQLLPIFPLHAVLFPDARLPLHIFEQRYKILIAECVDQDSEFGINLFNNGTLHPIGCTAVVDEIVKRYDDGRMDIIVEGKRRYHLEKTVETTSPYYVGVVSFVFDREEKMDDPLRQKAIGLYNQMVRVAFKGRISEIDAATERSKLLSFVMVQKAGFDLEQRQTFLSVQSENERLAVLVRHLEAAVPLLSSEEKRKELIMNDGYLPHHV
jgi:Lon protease-like protein